MNKWDFVLPHRFVINQSLQKETVKFRAFLDEYQQRYDSHYERAIAELDAFIEEMNNELERTRSEIVGRLLADEEAKKAFAEAVGEYVLAFFNRQLLYKKREVNAIQQDIGNSQHSDSWNTGGWQVLFDI
ncbi:MAG: hypothetical protein J5645_01330 [Lachnospiraceae bacterium]|nr:hypothetical protein [Lachnospiraceae bacterium]